MLKNIMNTIELIKQIAKEKNCFIDFLIVDKNIIDTIFNGKKPEKIEISQSLNVGIKIVKDNKSFIINSLDLSELEIRKKIDEALIAIDSLIKNKYDIIISLLSCGWHYSLETYIDLIKNTLSDEGIFVVDIRHDTDQLEYAKKHFKLINVLTNTAESKHTGGTIGDRYIFKKY
jgi:hypothetical protein